MILDEYGRELQYSSLENPAVPITSDRAYEILAGSNRTSSGIVINRTSVLGYPAFYRAITILSDYVAKLPAYINKHAKGGGKEKAKRHPAYKLLLKSPSNDYNAFTFFKTMQAHAVWSGNAYAYVIRDQFAKPLELVILDPERTTPVRVNGILWYVTTIDMGDYTEDRILPYSDVIHIKNFSHCGLVGYSLLDICKEALGLGLAAQKYGSVYFKNSAQPKYVIQMPGHLDDKDKVERFRTSWGAMHQGLENSHKVALLEDGATVNAISVSNADAEFIATREHEIATTVANIVGIPAHKLGVKIATSHNSLEAENKSFLNDTIDPWLCAWEQELEAKLLTENEKRYDTHFIQFDRSKMLQIEEKTRAEIAIMQLNNGIKTQQQYNEDNNLPNVGEEWEQWHRMPANIMFVEQALKEKEEAKLKEEQAIKAKEELAQQQAEQAEQQEQAEEQPEQ
jgi:HK97 family phage portal protein